MNAIRKQIHAVGIIAAIFLFCGCSKKSTDDEATHKEKTTAEAPSAPSAEEQARMSEEAKRQALAEFSRHFTNINGCWYAAVLKRSETTQMTNVTPVVRGAFAFERTDGGSRWYGDVVMEAESVRTFSIAKQTWTPWRKLASEKQLTYTVMNSNGVWVVENAYGDLFTIPKGGGTR
jgi:hypothetical protein